jgi:hypothetical protein
VDKVMVTAEPEMVTLQALLEELTAVPLSQLQPADAQRVFQLLSDWDKDAPPLPHGTGTAAMHADATHNLCPTNKTPQQRQQPRRVLLSTLSMEQQDTLMKVLYACMAAPSLAAGEPKSNADELRDVYDWYAALHEVTGDGAVVRVLVSR